MADKREQILVRLVAIASAIEGVTTVERNAGELDDEALPAIIILDADEAAEDSDPRRPGPRRIGMTPEIYLMAAAKRETPQAGSSVNRMRAAFVKAVLEDAELAAICGSNGDIRYEGCATALARGRSMQAEMGVSFTFSYVLKSGDL